MRSAGSCTKSVIDRAYEKDPIAASGEYGAEFRSDVQALLTPEAVDAVVERGCYELSPDRKHQYVGFVDAAGGSGQDAMTMAIAHSEGLFAVLDLIREIRPPFSPKRVVEQFSETFKSYHIHRVKADKWGSAFVTEEFGKHGVRCEQNAEPKSELYGELMPLVNSGKVRLLDNQRLINQLVKASHRAWWS